LVKRRIAQVLSAIAFNAHLSGFVTGKIWQGSSKGICVPGLNCYSCPGALGACPLGSLQSSLAGMALRFPFYVGGLLMLFGLLLGRRICGWLCPFGLFQDLLYKIPSPKLVKNSVTRKLTVLKYVIGIIFVLILPVVFYLQSGVGSPAFCKFICPAGTIEAGWTLPVLDKSLRSGLGVLYLWKSFLAVFMVIFAILLYRPFCRFICPLGAWYGLFNGLAFFGITVDEDKCTHCNACLKVCKMDCQKVGDRECINCGDCQKICPTQAIRFKKGA
jgi:ferredoxin-type protein NapH